MNTNSSASVNRFTHANRVPPRIVAAALLLLAGCSAGGATLVDPTAPGAPGTPSGPGTGGPGTPGVPTQIIVSADAAQLAAYASLPVHAVALDAAGDTVGGTIFSWTSSNASVATIDATGLVTGVAPGTTNITASSGSVTSSALALSVTGPPIATITVTAPSSSMTSLSTMQAQAVAKDALGKVVGGVRFSWTTTNSSAATVSSSGLITAGLVGTTEIQALAGGVSSNGLTVNVAP